MKSPHRTLTHLALCSAMLVAPFVVSAQPVNLVPTGALRFTINAGSVIAPVTTAFAIPLIDTPQAAGATEARISAMTATTLTITGANWAAGALATPAFPYAVRVTSGTAAGLTFLINSNTTDTLTFTGVNLTTFGLVTGSAGDSLRLIPVDTLNTLFGATTFLGGTNPTDADIVILGSSLQLAYYYNTSSSRWVSTTGPTTDRGNTPIPINGVISVTRKGNAMTLTLVGRVPDVRYSLIVPNSGSTYTHTGFPTDVTLGALSMQTALAGWVSAPAAGNADTLSVSYGAGWLTYFYNGSRWQETTGPATSRDSIIIVTGTPIQIFKRGVSAGTSTFNRNLPYSL
jgi:hypothetical protein